MSPYRADDDSMADQADEPDSDDEDKMMVISSVPRVTTLSYVLCIQVSLCETACITLCMTSSVHTEKLGRGKLQVQMA